MSELKRNITEFEEQVLRCCHHQFKALTQAEAAEELGVSVAKISRAIQSMVGRSRHCTPIRIMFPILTKRQYEVYQCVTDKGLSHAATAEILDIPVAGVGSVLTVIRKKGMYVPKRNKIVSYADSDPKQIKFKL